MIVDKISFIESQSGATSYSSSKSTDIDIPQDDNMEDDSFDDDEFPF